MNPQQKEVGADQDLIPCLEAVDMVQEADSGGVMEVVEEDSVVVRVEAMVVQVDLEAEVGVGEVVVEDLEEVEDSEADINCQGYFAIILYNHV